MTEDAALGLVEARRLLDSGDPSAALGVLTPLTVHPDPDLASEAWLLVGTARYREDDEPGALAAWMEAARSRGAGAWLGWRSAAEQLVRDGELDQAITAYREADRRAPAQERGAIANRIAWLLKETGHDFEARRQFNRARGPYAAFSGYISLGLIVINVAVFLADGALGGMQILGQGLFGGGGPLLAYGVLNGQLVAEGEWWRILTSAFFHLGLLHLGMNMYVLYLYGPIVEQMYGHFEFLAIYLLCAAGGSVLTILVLPEQFAAGASGAIFGLVGLLFLVARRHHAVIGRQARSMLAGLGTYLVVLLVFTFAVPGISWTGHLGGLVVGAVLGFALPPTGVTTLGAMWRTPSGDPLKGPMPALARVAVYVVVLALLVGGSYLAVMRLVG